MSRSCHQEGHVRLRDDVKRPYWQGLYRVRSEDQPGGKWKSENLGYKDEITKRQAQRRFQKIISKMESEIIRLPRSVMTVKTYIEDHYIPEFVNKRKPGTRRGYLQILKAHVLPALGAMELDQVTRRDVQLLINRLHSQSKARHTCDNVRNLIRSLFRQATRDEFLNSQNPATLIEMPSKDPKVPVAVPSAEQICALLDAVEPEFQMLTWFVVVTACRIGEALGLKWGAINFEDKLVWFLTARYLGEEHLTKGHRSQEPVVLMDEEIARLREYKTRTPAGDRGRSSLSSPEGCEAGNDRRLGSVGLAAGRCQGRLARHLASAAPLGCVDALSGRSADQGDSKAPRTLQSTKPPLIGTSSAIRKQREKQQRSRVNFSLAGRRNILQMLPQVLP